MFLDRISTDKLRLEAKEVQSALEKRMQLVAGYTQERFLDDIETLISMFEGEEPLVPDTVRAIEARMIPAFEEFKDAHGIYQTEFYSLLQACKMGFIKEGGLLTSVEIIQQERITKQQFHVQSYDALADIPDEQKRNKLPTFKVGRLMCATKRDYKTWSATRPRRRKDRE